MEDFLKEFDEHVKRYQEEREKYIAEVKRISDWNMKSMVERSSELGKDIPDEIMIWIHDCEPRGLQFFERNKEWFPDMFKEKEGNTERIF